MTSLTAPCAWLSANRASSQFRTTLSIVIAIAAVSGSTKVASARSIAPATAASRTIGCSSEGWYDTSYQPSDEQPIFLEVKCVMMKVGAYISGQIQARNGLG
jgi:hypothetical protein